MVKDYIAVDIETTGLNPQSDKIIEIGAIRYQNGEKTEEFSSLVNPYMDLPDKIVELTGITSKEVKKASEEKQVLEDFLAFAKEDILLGHNIGFDYSFLKTAMLRLGWEFERNGIDTLALCRIFHRELTSKSLERMCKYYNISNKNAHRALEDARTAAILYHKLIDSFGEGQQEIFQAIPLKYQPKKREPITPRQKKYLLALKKWHKIQQEYDMDKLSKSEASRLIDKIISEYGMIPNGIN